MTFQAAVSRGGVLERKFEARQIISTQNPHIKELVRLKNRRHRDETGLFIIEGFRELSRAQQQKAPIKSVYFSPELFLGENENALLNRAFENGAEVYEVGKTAFSKVSYRDRPDGLLAIGHQTHRVLEELPILLKHAAQPFLLIVEALEKPGNLGSIIRSADGAGVDAIVVCDQGTDIHNPNVIRSSIGTFFSVPIFVTSSQEACTFCKVHHIPIVAATPSAKKIYTQADYRQKVAFAVGREQIGLSKFLLSQADETVRIPMLGIADSLNVSGATSLLIYEVVRQRNCG